MGNTRQFRLIEALDKSRKVFLAFATLADRMGGDALDDIRTVKCRLVKELRDADMAELTACIKTQDGHYGLFLD